MSHVRTIEPSELRAWIEAMHRIYFMTTSVDEETAYRAERVDYSRTYGAFDRERVVGTFRSFASELFVPGGASIPADAITNVGVSPTHRRRGLLTEMMHRSLEAAAQRGDPVSLLFASEAQIYGRYGFGAATEHAQLLIRRHKAKFRNLPDGDVDFVSWTELREIAPKVYERFAPSQPGSMRIEPKRWDAMLGIGPTPFGPKPGDEAVVYRDETGEPQGWLRYKAEETWTETQPNGTLRVGELVAATPDAYARLWRFAFEVDLMAEIRAEGRPIAEPLPWLLVDWRAVHQTARHDGLWVRVLDPVAALSARRYSAPGGFVVEVIDPARIAGGLFRVEAAADGAGTCDRTEDEPDLTMTVEGLGAAYLGGTKLAILAAAGLVEERRAGALITAEAMFASPVVPWCWTEF